MNPIIQQLLQLQSLDQALQEINEGLSAIPEEIAQQQFLIQSSLSRLEEEKKKATAFLILKKDKELEVAAAEEKIRKNEKELNSVKSNEVYKGLLIEIETAKKLKEQAEDQILELMLNGDELAAQIKKAEIETKEFKQKIEQEIQEKETALAKLRSAIDQKKKDREIFALQVNPKAMALYKNVSKMRGASVLAYLEKDICSGCHTSLTPSMINEIQKNKELGTCECCSRIVYILETVSEPVAEK